MNESKYYKQIPEDGKHLYPDKKHPHQVLGIQGDDMYNQVAGPAHFEELDAKDKEAIMQELLDSSDRIAVSEEEWNDLCASLEYYKEEAQEQKATKTLDNEEKERILQAQLKADRLVAIDQNQYKEMKEELSKFQEEDRSTIQDLQQQINELRSKEANVKEAIQKAYQEGIAYQQALEKKHEEHLESTPPLDSTNRIVISKKEYEELKNRSNDPLPKGKRWIDEDDLRILQESNQALQKQVQQQADPKEILYHYLERYDQVIVDRKELDNLKQTVKDLQNDVMKEMDTTSIDPAKILYHYLERYDQVIVDRKELDNLRQTIKDLQNDVMKEMDAPSFDFEAMLSDYLAASHQVLLPKEEIDQYKSPKEVEAMIDQAYQLGLQHAKKADPIPKAEETTIEPYEGLQKEFEKFQSTYRTLQFAPQNREAQNDLLTSYLMMIDQIQSLQQEEREEWDQMIHTLPLLRVAHVLKKIAFIQYSNLAQNDLDQLAACLGIPIQKQNDLLKAKEEIWIYSLLSKK